MTGGIAHNHSGEWIIQLCISAAACSTAPHPSSYHTRLDANYRLGLSPNYRDEDANIHVHHKRILELLSGIAGTPLKHFVQDLLLRRIHDLAGINTIFNTHHALSERSI